jgi:hypothetical protein
MTITLAASSCLGGTVWVSVSRWGELWTVLVGRLDHGVGGSEMEMMGYGVIPILLIGEFCPKKKKLQHTPYSTSPRYAH